MTRKVRHLGPPLLLLVGLLVLATGCAGAVRSDAIRALVDVETSGLETLEQNLRASQALIDQVVETLEEVRGTTNVEGGCPAELPPGATRNPDCGFLWQLDQWALEVQKATFLTERLTTPPSDPDVRRAVLIKIAVIRETHEKAKKVLEGSLATAERELKNTYASLTQAVAALRDNLETVKRYTDSSDRNFVLTSLDADLIGALAQEIQGADTALENAVRATGYAGQVMSFLARFSSASSLEEAMEFTGALQDLLNRIDAASSVTTDG